jgi:hypothetical protein
MAKKLAAIQPCLLPALSLSAVREEAQLTGRVIF